MKLKCKPHSGNCQQQTKRQTNYDVGPKTLTAFAYPPNAMHLLIPTALTLFIPTCSTQLAQQSTAVNNSQQQASKSYKQTQYVTALRHTHTVLVQTQTHSHTDITTDS